MKTPPLFLVCCGILGAGSLALAQVPDAAPAPAAAPAAGGGAPAAGGGAAAGGGQSKGIGLGKDVPMFDPGSEIMTWDGKSWNVNNNRIFQARFEKYLNAPEATTEIDRQYQLVIANILNLLAPVNRIGREAETILAGGVTVAHQLDLLTHVVHTRDSIKQVRVGVAAYGVALDKLL